jgi:hypothetical protein
MKKLEEQHVLHGSLPQHVVQRVARELGVEGRSLETRYNNRLRRLEEHDAPVLAAVDLAASVTAGDFRSACAALAAALDLSMPVVERALWRDRSRALAELRVAERRRRQHLAETAACQLCATPTGQRGTGDRS